MTKGKILLILTLIAVSTWGCSVKYSFTGASISPDVKTVNVQYFNNTANLISVSLSPNLTDELITRIQGETRLRFVEQDADVSFQGTVTDYRTDPVSISAGEYAQMNRLTVSIRVTFENRVQPQYSFTDKTYTSYADYDTRRMLIEVEQDLHKEIIEKLVDNIFNDAFSNW